MPANSRAVAFHYCLRVDISELDLDMHKIESVCKTRTFSLQNCSQLYVCYELMFFVRLDNRHDRKYSDQCNWNVKDGDDEHFINYHIIR